jgi:hypothetical protein
MTETSTAETRIEQIVKGIDGLSEEDYTSSGLPRVESLEAITGIAEITGDERDEAWEKHQAENKPPSASPSTSPSASPSVSTSPSTSPSAKPEKDVVEAPYVVAEGKAITSRKGILGPGEPVFPKYFGPNGDTVLKKLEEDGMVVAT